MENKEGKKSGSEPNIRGEAQKALKKKENK